MDAEMIRGIVEVSKRDVQIMLEAGYLYMELNKNQEAEEILQGVGYLIPHSDIPHTALGNLYFSMGHFAPALKAHKKAVEINPESALAHASVGETLLFLHKYAEAMTHLDKAISLDPEGSAGQMAESLKQARDMGVFG
ncbi:hypothetical protein KAI87_04705 [Myxococcota bacterium]|nr:hypothetical protein [Myxococcota bacterium]